jgi:beta-mannosidase
MLQRWQVVRSSPGQFTRPEQLSGQWTTGMLLETPVPVATIADSAAVDDSDWWHRCIVQTEEPVCVDFGGLSFPSTVFVDGRPVADCESMFLPVRIDIPEGRHEVSICFGSLNAWLQTRRPRGRWRSSLVAAAGLRWARTTLIGRAPVYGDLPAPVGFWRPIVATPARLTATNISVAADPATGVAEIAGRTMLRNQAVDIAVEGPSNVSTSVSTRTGSDCRFRVTVPVGDPELWWPNGYGSQNLYRATIRVGGQVVAERLFGFRSAVADTTGGAFEIRINARPVFCRGVAWVPADPIRLSDQPTLRAHLETFAGAGANMVRVVGGLVYEQPEFFDLCAQLGLMVWQDAMQATFDPPEELSELIVRELVEVLTAVSGNPALTVVSGGSETLQRPEMLGLEHGRFAMPVIDSLLPEAVARHSDVPYVRSSPSSETDGSGLAIRPDSGIAHWFGVGGYLRPVSDVRRAGVRFAAECLAFANPPSDSAVERHFGSVSVAGHDPAWKAGVPRDRGASWDFEDVRDFYVREVFGEDPLAVRRIDPHRYLELGRLAIAEAMQQCYAFWRQRESSCSGALVLSGRDLAPGAGWGLLDVDGEAKAALRVLSRLWAPISVVLTDAGLSGVRIDLYNDTPDMLRGELALRATNSQGHRTIEAERTVTLQGCSSLTFFDSDLTGSFRDLSNSFAFGHPNADGVEVVVRFAEPQHEVRDALIVHPRPGQTRADLRALACPRDEAEWNLEVSSATSLRYVAIDVSGWEPSDNYFHLPAGLPYRLRLRPRGDAAADAPSGKVRSVDCLVDENILVDT